MTSVIGRSIIPLSVVFWASFAPQQAAAEPTADGGPQPRAYAGPRGVAPAEQDMSPEGIASASVADPPQPAPKPAPQPQAQTTPPSPQDEDAQHEAEKKRFKRWMSEMRPNFSIPLRINTIVQGDERNELDGYRFDSILTLPRMWGKITDLVGWQLAGFARAHDFANGSVRILDAIAEINVVPEFHVWAGRFTVPADRSNLSGPFFGPLWNYPGIYGNVFTIGPTAGAVGRDVGAMVWGDVGKGRFKYFFATQALEDQESKPRMTGRVNLSFLDREPGFYNAGSYLGKRDVVSVGGSLQFQPDGRRTPIDSEDPQSILAIDGHLWGAEVDFIAEKNFGRAGVPTLEGTYYVFDEHAPYRHAYFISGAYLLPWQLGPGQLQVGTRWQQALPNLDSDRALHGMDATAAFLFAGYRARLAVVYQRQQLADAGPAWNAIHLGFQFIAM